MIVLCLLSYESIFPDYGATQVGGMGDGFIIGAGLIGTAIAVLLVRNLISTRFR